MKPTAPKPVQLVKPWLANYNWPPCFGSYYGQETISCIISLPCSSMMNLKGPDIKYNGFNVSVLNLKAYVDLLHFCDELMIFSVKSCLLGIYSSTYFTVWQCLNRRQATSPKQLIARVYHDKEWFQSCTQNNLRRSIFITIVSQIPL